MTAFCIDFWLSFEADFDPLIVEVVDLGLWSLIEIPP